MNVIKPMVPEAPISPIIKDKNKKVVKYMDGEVGSGDSNELKAIASELQCYLYYYQDWGCGQGYDITDDEEGCSGYILADYDILGDVKTENDIKCIDADEIFSRYDMEYDTEMKFKILILLSAE